MENVYSFDIFDTLLLRPYADPQEVWKVLEEEENASGFAKVRKEADRITYAALKTKGGETSIEEAYELIPQWKHLMQKEMDLERRVLRANPETLRWWNDLGKEGKRRIIISDMYLPSDFIKSVLIENGFEGWDAFYLSRDYNARKVTGELFKIVLENEQIQSHQLVHTGDNKHSDVNVPNRMGIITRYYTKVIERLYEQFPFTKKIDGRLAGVLAIGLHQFKFETPENTYWHRLGFMMAGVLGYIYVKWIVETSRSLGINHLMFVARDGYIWEKICNALYPDIKTNYFYASRLTSIAVLGAIGSDPWAIKDRQNYIDTHLRGADLNKIKEEYTNYINRFQIDKKTALIDGCSSGFSAQRLVEKVIGKNVFSFYLLAMAPKHNAASLYSTHLYSLQFQMLSEFLFGAPEHPIVGVFSNGPIYADLISKEEEFKISVSQQIMKGAVECAKILKENNINLSAGEWLDYVDNFMKYRTLEDKNELNKARNAADVEQKDFHTIDYDPYPRHGFYIVRKKWRVPISFCYTTLSNRYQISFSRKGVSVTKINVATEFNDICLNTLER